MAVLESAICRAVGRIPFNPSSRMDRRVKVNPPDASFDVEISCGIARRHIDAVYVVSTGVYFEAHGCQDNRMVSTRRIPRCPLIVGA